MKVHLENFLSTSKRMLMEDEIVCAGHPFANKSLRPVQKSYLQEISTLGQDIPSPTAKLKEKMGCPRKRKGCAKERKGKDIYR